MVYDYPRSELKAATQLVDESPSFKKYKISFSSKAKTGDFRNDEVSGIYFEPRLTRHPPVVLLHSWLTNKLIMPVYSQMGKEMSKGGIPCLLPTLPYHMERTPRGRLSGAAFLSPDPSSTLESFRQAVVDVSCSLDWLQQHTGAGEFSIVGVSLGALVASITMGVDERIKKGVFILGGGDVGEILWRGLATFILKKKANITRDLYLRQKEQYDKYLAKVRSAGDPTRVEADSPFFLFDPLTYAHLIKARPVLMINARFDCIIPRRSAVRLWQALEEPRITWLSATHISSVCWFGYILKNTIEFLTGQE